MFWVTGTHSHKRIILTSPAKNMLANPDFLNTQNIVEAIQYFGCFKKSLKELAPLESAKYIEQ